MGVANSGAASMHQSTWVVLSLLMFGEIAILAFGGFVLWLAGEFGDAPRWTRLRSLRKRGHARLRGAMRGVLRHRVGSRHGGAIMLSLRAHNLAVTFRRKVRG